MEDGLVLALNVLLVASYSTTVLILIVVEDGLVPINLTGEVEIVVVYVLILIVVEDGLVLLKQDVNEAIVEGVLILIVVEDGLVLDLIRLF